MRIRTANGSGVPLSVLADVTMEQGYVSIEHAQRRRVLKVYADVDEAGQRGISSEFLAKLIYRVEAVSGSEKSIQKGENIR
ncbi:MAG: efflux RND transporter permease subunit [Deltaproteobacteria bacterium]|nr:efflux RND transporter permease subunit [Deltaproteobacteria bacterium]